jgi:hypothetical protein
MNARQDSHLTAFSESLNVQKTSSIQAFERSMEQLARDGIERWRQKFESGLHALVKNLNEQFRAESSATQDE